MVNKTSAFRWRGLPLAIWAMGFGSLFMDISSELIHSLLPVFMVTVLGTSVTTVGLVEGIAEATAAITKVFSGVISDFLRKRKALMILGYGLAAITKPLFPMANSIAWVLSARFIDRLGKGIRGAPRDALIAEVAPKELRGAAFGLRQALDSVGALLGPVLALLLMLALANDIRAVMWVAVIPALISVAILWLFVRDPESLSSGTERRAPTLWRGLTDLNRRYWLVVGFGAVFTLARFSEAFLVLRAENLGLGLAYVPVVMVVLNIFYAGAAYPAGMLADRMEPRQLLVIGVSLLVVADILLAMAQTQSALMLGVAFWGLHMAFTQGLLAKLVADLSPPAVRATAFGVFNMVTGIALLLASVIAGLLWDMAGPGATFTAGAILAGITLLGIGFLPRTLTSSV